MDDTISFTVNMDATGEDSERIYKTYLRSVLSGAFGDESPLNIDVSNGVVVLQYRDLDSDVCGETPLEDAVNRSMAFDDSDHADDVAYSIEAAALMADEFEAQAVRLRERIAVLSSDD